MRGAELVACMKERIFLWGNLRERDQFEDIGVDGYIILKWIFKK
jgi:hypothetical protein